jgi:hypothetical protein
MATLEEVVQTAERWAAVVFKTDMERRCQAVTMAWFYWDQGPAHLPAGVWARCGVRAALHGRDLPGVCSARRRDVWNRLTRWQGAGMNFVRDRRPGPEKIAQDRDWFRYWLTRLTDQEFRLVWDAHWGLTGLELAARLQVSPGRISQLRRAAWERWEEE